MENMEMVINKVMEKKAATHIAATISQHRRKSW